MSYLKETSHDNRTQLHNRTNLSVQQLAISNRCMHKSMSNIAPNVNTDHPTLSLYSRTKISFYNTILLLTILK